MICVSKQQIKLNIIFPLTPQTTTTNQPSYFADYNQSKQPPTILLCRQSTNKTPGQPAILLCRQSTNTTPGQPAILPSRKQPTNKPINQPTKSLPTFSSQLTLHSIYVWYLHICDYFLLHFAETISSFAELN